ncbi:hypothetical protein BO94DRAFT_624299 [Aspergillus sclerotioniger CBS 115572]|uniref:Uncharacterized protein n=1 Tax=Aspergillus sclerotioniger CBS 115572 TaxID=1450535 RepID=A0A317WM19_9EURO|nr:hypothetical protein BO94DRAFT_624299 [Aspergillus sclerotioniger CBS 115572]PWY87085.1 hypothetical protein BO94DRAFT_624299 [Aspergillus sclerotioniger CBS 115572]
MDTVLTNFFQSTSARSRCRIDGMARPHVCDRHRCKTTRLPQEHSSHAGSSWVHDASRHGNDTIEGTRAYSGREGFSSVWSQVLSHRQGFLPGRETRTNNKTCPSPPKTPPTVCACLILFAYRMRFPGAVRLPFPIIRARVFEPAVYEST